MKRGIASTTLAYDAATKNHDIQFPDNRGGRSITGCRLNLKPSANTLNNVAAVSIFGLRDINGVLTPEATALATGNVTAGSTDMLTLSAENDGAPIALDGLRVAVDPTGTAGSITYDGAIDVVVSRVPW